MKQLIHNLYFFLLLLVTSLLKAGDGHPVPVANYEVYNLCYGSITTFSNTSTSLENQVYLWKIMQTGNAVPIYTSSATNISFQFPVKGSYTVELDVINYVTPTHTHGDAVIRTIYVDSIVRSNFDFKSCANKFSNLSNCATSFIWDFGDSTPTSTLVSPAHTYSASNNYTVTLIAKNGLVSNTSTLVIWVYQNFLTNDFTMSPIVDTIQFKSLQDSIGAINCDCTFLWAYGDGATYSGYQSSGWKTKHVYQRRERDSVYQVFLLLKDLCFTVWSQKSILIKGIGKDVTNTVVFPSPVVHGYLNVESVDKENLLEIRIMDCLGKRLDNLKVWDKPYGYYIWVGDIASGAYVVQLVFKDRLENHKIIKE